MKTNQEKETILNNLVECLIYQDMQNRIIWANSAAGKLVGLVPEKLVGHCCYEIWHQRNEPCPGCPVMKARETGQPAEGEIISPEGRVWWIRGNPVRDISGNISGVVEIALEITKRKKAEEMHQTFARRWQTTFDAINDAVCLLDREMKIIQCNITFINFLKKPWDEIRGRHCWELVHGTTQPLEQCPVTRMFKTLRREMSVLPLGDGWFEVVADPLLDENGKIISAIHIVSDVTERKRSEKELERSLRKLREVMEGTIQAMALTIEKRDPYTAGHQRRVTVLASAIAKEMGLSDEQIEGVQVAAMIHDLGKISIATEILSKPGRISEIEFSLIKIHPQVGYDILKTIEFPYPIAQIVFQHHERLNGSGYPSGLSGEDILLEARILGVADVVEAMSSHRPYRSALGIDRALEEISQNKDVLYDSKVVDACLKLFTEKRFRFE